VLVATRADLRLETKNAARQHVSGPHRCPPVRRGRRRGAAVSLALSAPRMKRWPTRSAFDSAADQSCLARVLFSSGDGSAKAILSRGTEWSYFMTRPSLAQHRCAQSAGPRHMTMFAAKTAPSDQQCEKTACHTYGAAELDFKAASKLLIPHRTPLGHVKPIGSAGRWGSASEELPAMVRSCFSGFTCLDRGLLPVQPPAAARRWMPAGAS
jgi:hypothetical protein